MDGFIQEMMATLKQVEGDLQRYMELASPIPMVTADMHGWMSSLNDYYQQQRVKDWENILNKGLMASGNG